MNKNDCFYLGVITKPNGLKGGVSVFLDVDNPQDYAEMESVFVEINKSLVPFFIENIQIRGKKQAVFKFEGTDSIEQAGDLINKELWLPAEVLPALTGNKFYFHEVKGFEVVDQEKGVIGIVSEILEYPNNSILQISFQKKEILIPIRDEVIQTVDRENKRLNIIAPPGLIDIYLADSHDKEERDDN